MSVPSQKTARFRSRAISSASAAKTIATAGRTIAAAFRILTARLPFESVAGRAITIPR